MLIRARLLAEPWSRTGGEEVELLLPPDATLTEAVDEALGADLPLAEARDVVMAEIDGRPVPAEIWTATPLERGVALTLTALPRGGGFRTIAQIALIAAAIAVGNPYIAAAILIGGNLALNALFPAPTPGLPGLAGPNEQPDRLAASAAANRLRLYGRRALVLGDMRWTPDLLARQLVVPTRDGALDPADPPGTVPPPVDHVVVVPGVADAALGIRLDRMLFLDLGIGRLAVAHPDGTVALRPGIRETRAERLLEADSTPIAPEYVVGPGGALAPPAGLRGSAAWPLRARAVIEDAHPVSGAAHEIDRTRSASRLLVVLGGALYDSEAGGRVIEESTDMRFLGSAPGEPDIDQTVVVSNDSLTPEYIGVELAGGERDWTISGGDRSLSALSRVELSVVGSYWLAPLADLDGRRLPSTVCAVRIAGQVGAPSRRTLRVRTTQLVPVPNAAGVWGGESASRNPAAILRAFALGWYEDGELVAGTGRDSETIDHEGLARFHRRCEAHDPPLRCDMVLQGDQRPAEQLERLIAATGRAEISWSTGKLGVIWAEPGDVPQGLISFAQVRPGSLNMAWRPDAPPSEIVATYLDRAVWDGREVRIEVPGATATGRPRQVRIEGVTERAAALFHAAAIAGEEAFHRRGLSWRAGREGAMLTRGTLWLMAADLISGGLTGRLRAFGDGLVRLDRPVRLGAQPWLAIDAPGSGLHRTPVLAADATPAGGLTDALALVQPVPGFDAGDVARPRDVVWRLYDFDRPPQPVRIVANRPVSETEFEIAARDESAAFWEFLDTYRDAPAAPPRIDLPDHVEIDADGQWAWPQAWTDAGIVDASMILSGAGGGEQGDSNFIEGDDDPKGGSFDRYISGGAGANARSSRVTLAGGEVITARGGAGGGRSRYDHNALGEPGGSGRPARRTGYRGRTTGGFDGQAGERVSRQIVAADTPLTVDLAAGGAGGAAAGGDNAASPGGRGRPARLLIYPLPP